MRKHGIILLTGICILGANTAMARYMVSSILITNMLGKDVPVYFDMKYPYFLDVVKQTCNNPPKIAGIPIATQKCSTFYKVAPCTYTNHMFYGTNILPGVVLKNASRVTVAQWNPTEALTVSDCTQAQTFSGPQQFVGMSVDGMGMVDWYAHKSKPEQQAIYDCLAQANRIPTEVTLKFRNVENSWPTVDLVSCKT